MSHDWEWSVSSLLSALRHRERFALMREVPYQTTQSTETKGAEFREGKALSLNISSMGMLLLMDWPPGVDQVLRLHVPTAVDRTMIPTVAEVRWLRDVPFLHHNGLYFVGVKFLSRIT